MKHLLVFLKLTMKTNSMIYIHIPFCDSKCFYCNFCSAKYNEKIKDNYFKKLIEEIKFNSNKNKNISSIYIGGGTPSSVNEKYIKLIINELKNNFNIEKNTEISIEANPCSITESKLKTYKQIGINRISIGVQSLNNKQLKIIGRRHTKKQAINAIKLAKKYFDNINCDLLIGIPKQNYLSLKHSVKCLLKQKINHISSYMLICEKGTKLTKQIEDNQVKIVNEDKCVDYYNKIVSYLKSKNYYRYEISNFAHLGYECRHNLGYWNLTDYYGFGLSAHSYVDGFRYSNTTDMQEYLESKFDYKKEGISNEEKIEELIMLSLRTQKGVSINDLNKLGYDILKEKKNIINSLKDFINVSQGYISIKDDKFGVCNQIILDLLP